MNRLDGLDALRGIAALTVLGFHLWTVFRVLPAFSHAYLAVDFFFMLSGYVMARTYEPKFGTGLSPATFMVIRFKRLFAPMAVGAAIGLILFASTGMEARDVAIAFIATLVFIPQTLSDPFILNRPAWSIFFELVANVVHALLLWRLRLRIVLLSALGCLLLLALYAWPFGSILVGNKLGTFLGGFPRVLLAYGIGVALWRGPRVLNGRVGVSCLTLAGTLIILPHGLLFDLAFILIVSPLVILVGAKSAPPIASIVGKLSFPLYAVHYPILQAAKVLGIGPWVGAIASIGVAVAINSASERISERRAIQV